ncbi:hypothetical protein ACA910_007064 [Epithemia clementina (nom. ined.)]
MTSGSSLLLLKSTHHAQHPSNHNHHKAATTYRPHVLVSAGLALLFVGAAFWIAMSNLLSSSSFSTTQTATSLYDAVYHELNSILAPSARHNKVAPLNTRRPPVSSSASSSSSPSFGQEDSWVPSRIGPTSTRSTSHYHHDHDDHDQLWSNDFNLVHVIHTRFMQHQPNLTHLGVARLDLFEAFTLPSMLQQSNQQYLWLIWTDPHLEPHLMKDLIALVSHIPNVLVLAAYHNEQESNLRTLYGHELKEWQRVVRSGDLGLLSAYYKASQSHILVETDLDADDALSQTFVEAAQAQAARTVGHDFRPASQHSETYCPKFHAEWRFFADVANGESGKNAAADYYYGQLVHFHDRNFCIQSGMTIVYHLQAQARRLSLCSHFEEGMCCPNLPQPPPAMNYPKPMPDYADPGRRDILEEQVDNDAQKESQDEEERPHQLEIVWVNEHPDLEVIGDEVNTLDFFERHRELTQTIDNKYFFNNEAKWKAAIKGCCLAFEGFDDTTFIDGLDVKSTKAGKVRPDISKWWDVLAFEWKTTITFDEGMHALGGYFNLVDVGGPGAGINVYLDVLMDGKDAVHIIGGTRGFFGFVSTVLVKNVVLMVGPDGYYQNFPTRSEAYTIDWLILAFPPFVPCRRQLRTTLPSLVDNAEDSDKTTVAAFQSLEASVLMSRTPTAAGMKHVLPEKTGGGKNSVALSTYQDDQDRAWQYMQDTFGVDKEMIADVHLRMEDDMHNILVDALNGQCTPGHSCKESTKRALGYLLDKQRLLDEVNGEN